MDEDLPVDRNTDLFVSNETQTDPFNQFHEHSDDAINDEELNARASAEFHTRLAAAIIAVNLNAEINGFFNEAAITAVDTHAEDNDFYDGDNDDGGMSQMVYTLQNAYTSPSASFANGT
ncbi:hypothetical protein JAAARDRAFT_187420 [Jaapia argillacea MUCL 33604]|uniref:Uncharacterized protein n=1 Tax=Jaapia argillacea MUCL 33604 TaxID=933084 RepID=A0A067QCZ8_9AGAM|nr:hypothetical protein JAAARDRAFT_187420 [Jaapia argillacea MUCL 33604]